MKNSLGIPLVALALAAPFPAVAQHYGRAYLDIRLAEPDSVKVTVETDGLDLRNAVWTFPALEADGSGQESFRLYEQRIEAYLQQKVKLRADGRPVPLKVTTWKPGGKGRDDGFDPAAIQASYHSITLGGKLPAGTKSIQAWSELFVEKVINEKYVPVMDFYLFDGKVALRRNRSQVERWVRFPVEADSIEAMRKSPLTTVPPRAPTDHSGHGH